MNSLTLCEIPLALCIAWHLAKLSVRPRLFCFILKGLQYAAFLQDSSPKQGELILHYVILL